MVLSIGRRFVNPGKDCRRNREGHAQLVELWNAFQRSMLSQTSPIGRWFVYHGKEGNETGEGHAQP